MRDEPCIAMHDVKVTFVHIVWKYYYRKLSYADGPSCDPCVCRAIGTFLIFYFWQWIRIGNGLIGNMQRRDNPHRRYLHLWREFAVFNQREQSAKRFWFARNAQVSWSNCVYIFKEIHARAGHFLRRVYYQVKFYILRFYTVQIIQLSWCIFYFTMFTHFFFMNLSISVSKWNWIDEIMSIKWSWETN